MKRLYVLSFSLSLLQGLLIPVLVLYMLKLGFGTIEIGIVSGSSSLLYIVGALTSSFIVCRLGDSRTVALSLGLLAAGYLLLTFSQSLLAIFSATGLVLLGFGIFWPSIENIVSNTGGRVSLFSFSWSSGSLLVMALVYPASLVDPKLAFVLFMALSVLLVTLANFRHDRSIQLASFTGVLGALRNASLAWLLCTVYSISSSGILTFYPVLVDERRLPQILLSATLFSMIFSRTSLFYLFDKIPRQIRRLDLASIFMVAPALILL